MHIPAALAATILAILLAFTGPAAAQVSGWAVPIDGDTIEIMGERVRLHGIDAPESDQKCTDAAGVAYPCGEQATRALRALIDGQNVSCRQTDTDKYGRIVAVCRRGEVDLNAAMVREGWAVAYVEYATDYVAEEAQAKSARRGIWGGKFIVPAAYRRGGQPEAEQRSPGPAVAQAQDCSIKGNISKSGERIYHVPGGTFYARTKIDEGAGERWFCTEQEAESAGWRRSKQ
jgi:endonuclease YncB( thermonuclease family)